MGPTADYVCVWVLGQRRSSKYRKEEDPQTTHTHATLGQEWTSRVWIKCPNEPGTDAFCLGSEQEGQLKSA